MPKRRPPTRSKNAPLSIFRQVPIILGVAALLFGYHLYQKKSGYELYLKKNGGFATWKVRAIPLDRAKLPLPPEDIASAMSPGKDKLKDLLSQKFTFLGRGVQSYAFLGEDGETVLKIFKCYRYETHDTLASLPLPSSWKVALTKKIHRRTSRLYRLYSGCAIAAYEVPSLTLVDYLHLFKTEDLKVSLKLEDRLRVIHTVDADSAQFLLQKKMIVADKYAKDLIRNGDRNGFTEMLAATEELLVERSNQGIADADFAFHKNVGFINGKAFLLDVGSISKQNSRTTNARAEIKHLERVLLKRYPAATLWLEEYFAKNPYHLALLENLGEQTEALPILK